MKILLALVVVILAGIGLYDSDAWSVGTPKVLDIWPVMVETDPERGNVMLSRADFDAIVRAFNDNLYELRVLRVVKGCP